MILGGVDGDAVHPGIEGALGAKLAKRPVSLDEGLLGHVLHLGVVADVAADQAQNLVLVLLDQKVKGSGIALLRARHQLLVRFLGRHVSPPRRCRADDAGPSVWPLATGCHLSPVGDV